MKLSVLGERLKEIAAEMMAGLGLGFSSYSGRPGGGGGVSASYLRVEWLADLPFLRPRARRRHRSREGGVQDEGRRKLAANSHMKLLVGSDSSSSSSSSSSTLYSYLGTQGVRVLNPL